MQAPASEPAAPPPQGDGGLVRVRLDLAYDGTGYSGWARQPGERTVQGDLEEALGRVLRMEDPVVVTCAGRTDAGVHARGQVCHLDLPVAVLARLAPRPGGAWQVVLGQRLNGVLRPQIRLRRAELAPPGFDARFSALWRRYAYRICDVPVAADPLRRFEVLLHPGPLDLPAMNAASDLLVGEHDFAAYCRRREGATTVRRLRELVWSRDAGGLAVARVVADAFCHHMVRSLVGALLAVGTGRRVPEWPRVVLGAAVRDSAVQVVPAHGLTLEEVAYPPPEELAARARLARRVRTEQPPQVAGESERR